ncbi:SMC-Scp complex subunit ScpB [Membranicola marinus]|uniref:SMC-Scp complex subunit ScpB n=2 Tax=Membranihabitans marinus TaxID=1227546 RepID=A0A953HLM1_9BACT|nr:SMC-Scp complex subunit ScpB [Membranihabitans marinus]
MKNKHLKQHIEALIFIANPSITLLEIMECLNEKFNTTFDERTIADLVDQLMDHYAGEDSSFEILEMNGGFRFMTKPAYEDTLTTYLKQVQNNKLSRTAMETLSIIAYKQPVTKAVIEQIRGVNCDYSIQKLLEKDLVTIMGRGETIGKPLLYGTSDKFMDYFGLNSIKDLPVLKDFEDKKQVIGDKSAVAGEALKNTSEN